MVFVPTQARKAIAAVPKAGAYVVAMSLGDHVGTTSTTDVAVPGSQNDAKRSNTIDS